MVKSEQRRFSTCNGRMGLTDLFPEIVSEILSRLPIESILRCRSVCKIWYALTQDPQFINLHLSKTYNQPYRFILRPGAGDTSSTASSLVFLDTEECKARQIPVENLQLNGLKIMCSCNGLLCIASTRAANPVFICNPITRESVMLPSSELELALGHKVGLGFDPSSGKYKAVRTCVDFDDDVDRFEVITLGESSWREVTAPHSLQNHDICDPVFWNGALCWKLDELEDGSTHQCILAFDLSDEKFQIISFPDSVVPPLGLNLELLDLRGCLTLVEHDCAHMGIWEVRGNKVGDLSICLRNAFDTYVRWNRSFFYAMVSTPNLNSYLLQVSTYSDHIRRKDHFTQFFPKMALYLPLEIPGLPSCFRTVCFKPSLVSPKAALLGV